MENEKKLNTPLVSIVVITYNSSQYVLETLESAKSQTYQNIELIVTDDCSSDDTVAVCEQWIKENQERFVRTLMITTPKNTGIPANCNRGVKNTNGEWIKIIAGDDALYEDILTNYINHIKLNPEILFIHSNPVIFLEYFTDKNLVEVKDVSHLAINNYKIKAHQQFEILLRSGPIYPSTVMAHKKVYEKVDFFNENYLFWEDTPFYLNVTQLNIKLYYLNIKGSKYRISKTSVQKNINGSLYSRFEVSKDKYTYDLLLNYYTNWEKKLTILLIILNNLLRKIFKNKKSFFSIFLRVCLTVLFVKLLHRAYNKNLKKIF